MRFEMDGMGERPEQVISIYLHLYNKQITLARHALCVFIVELRSSFKEIAKICILKRVRVYVRDLHICLYHQQHSHVLSGKKDGQSH